MLVGDNEPGTAVGAINFTDVSVEDTEDALDTADTLGTPSLAASWRTLAALEPAPAGWRMVYCLFTVSGDFTPTVEHTEASDWESSLLMGREGLLLSSVVAGGGSTGGG